MALQSQCRHLESQEEAVVFVVWLCLFIVILLLLLLFLFFFGGGVRFFGVDAIREGWLQQKALL